MEHVTRLVLPCTTKTNKQHRPAPSHGTQLCNAYPLQSGAGLRMFAVDFDFVLQISRAVGESLRPSPESSDVVTRVESRVTRSESRVESRVRAVESRVISSHVMTC